MQKRKKKKITSLIIMKLTRKEQTGLAQQFLYGIPIRHTPNLRILFPYLLPFLQLTPSPFSPSLSSLCLFESGSRSFPPGCPQQACSPGVTVAGLWLRVFLNASIHSLAFASRQLPLQGCRVKKKKKEKTPIVPPLVLLQFRHRFSFLFFFFYPP